MRSKRGLEALSMDNQVALPGSASERTVRPMAPGGNTAPCDLFTVKTPTGQLIKSSCRSLKAEAIEDYVFSMVHHGFLADRKDWYGPAFIWRYWLQLRRAGYTVARIRVTILVDEESGWQIPDLQEVAA